MSPHGEHDAAQQDGEHLVTVRLLSLPLRVHERAQQHSEAMQREFRLIVEQARTENGSVPARLLALSTVLAQRYGAFTEEQEQRIEDGIAAGDESLDELVFEVPADAADASVQLGAILDEADEFCARGELLTLATPPDLVAYRQWYLDNFVAQAAGGDPVPWREPAQS